MEPIPEAMPHGAIIEVFPEIYFVSGTMQAELEGSIWQFSRNMTIVREGNDLTLINTVRLNPEGLAALDQLGKVKNVVRIGDLHGLDDAFYVSRYSAKYWGFPGMTQKNGLAPDTFLKADGMMPFDCSLFAFETTSRPEGILKIDSEDGIMIACDALMNWIEVDGYFSEESGALMQEAGFIQPANCGPLWMKVSEPGPSDFERLKEISFEHALCGHGAPLKGGASDTYVGTFARLFGV